MYSIHVCTDDVRMLKHSCIIDIQTMYTQGLFLLSSCAYTTQETDSDIDTEKFVLLDCSRTVKYLIKTIAFVGHLLSLRPSVC